MKMEDGQQGAGKKERKKARKEEREEGKVEVSQSKESIDI
jgi:hypothetical protein